MDSRYLDIVNTARSVSENAYAPYSKFNVGAALLGKNGKIYTGVNIENASYPCGICAERSAVAAAVTDGQTEFEAIAIYAKQPPLPCGMCRQVLSEFGDLKVVAVSPEKTSEYMLSELLTHQFEL